MIIASSTASYHLNESTFEREKILFKDLVQTYEITKSRVYFRMKTHLRPLFRPVLVDPERHDSFSSLSRRNRRFVLVFSVDSGANQ